MFRQTCCVVLLLAVSGCNAPSPQPEATPDWSRLIESANDVLLNQGRLDRLGEFFAPSYGGPGGQDRIRSFISELRTAFPDLSVEVEILMIGADRVAWRRRHRGTHLGDYAGLAATRREMTWQSMTVSRIENGLIAEEWGVSGLNGALRAPE